MCCSSYVYIRCCSIQRWRFNIDSPSLPFNNNNPTNLVQPWHARREISPHESTLISSFLPRSRLSTLPTGQPEWRDTPSTAWHTVFLPYPPSQTTVPSLDLHCRVGDTASGLRHGDNGEFSVDGGEAGRDFIRPFSYRGMTIYRRTFRGGQGSHSMEGEAS